MWRLVGHKTKRGYICDVCDSLHLSMDELIPHVHAHGFTRVEAIFLFGAVYGLTEDRGASIGDAAALGRS